MHSANVKVPSSHGTTLAATIDFPDSPPRAFAIFAHCFAGSRQTPGAARTAKRLAHHGIATLRFDFPGLGQSDGDFADTSFSQNVDDIVAVADWLSQNYSPPQLLMGHSLGGAAALAAGSRIRSLKAVATIGAPFDPAHSVLHYADKIGEVDANGAVEVTLGGRKLIISRGFLEDLAETNPETYLAKLRKPLLTIHSPTDATVSINNAQTILRATRYPKSLISLDKADHLLTKQGAAARAADLIAAWSQAFIIDENPPAPVDGDTAVALPTPGTKYKVVASHNNRRVEVDLPKSDGGKADGFSPVGLVMSALAASTIHAVRDAAKDMPLADVHVQCNHVHGNVIERRIELVGDDLTDEQRKALKSAGRASTIDGLLGAAQIVEMP